MKRKDRMTEHAQVPLTFMAVHAHPDDEVFGTGGTFALLAARGVRTVLVTATGGEEGEIVDPDLSEEEKQAMFPRLAEVRRGELQAAAQALQIGELRSLGYRDSGMAGTEANQNPASFHRATFDEAVRKVVALIREFRPQVIVTYDPFGSYGHPDHLQAHRVTLAAFEAASEPRCFPDLPHPIWQPAKLYYTAMPRSAMEQGIKAMREQGVPGPWDNPDMNTDAWGMPDELISTHLDVTDYFEQKMQAFRAHRTQISLNDFLFTLPAEIQRQFFGTEHFILAKRALAPYNGAPEHDFFADLN
jgi:N-acetyl-1-D-myo-inositol-2-amino-2-deoxy-alpha-D-glucopyranoside deacetylase